jgi:hypothetical protein
LLDDIENERAGAWLYFKRGKNDNDPNGAAQMQWHWDNAEKELLRILESVVETTIEAAGLEGMTAIFADCRCHR